MYRGQTVGVVVPAYNEDAFVGDVIETVPGLVDRVYVVDDCSTDDTWRVVERTLRRSAGDTPPASSGDGALPSVAAADPDADGLAALGRVLAGDVAEREDGTAADAAGFDHRVLAVRHAANAGVGGAIQTGYRLALADGIDVTAVMSGDGQMDPDILDRILDPVAAGDAAYAKGDRLRYAKYRREMSRWRTFGNFLLTYLTRVASGYWQMTDPQNGYTAISREALEAIDLASLYDDYGFSNHVLVRLNTHGFRIADVPMRAVYGDETSYIRYSRFIPALSVLLLWSYLRRLTHRTVRRESPPAVAFQIGGLAAFALGVAVVAASATPASRGPSSLAGGTLCAAAAGLFSAGIAADRRRGAALVVRVDRADRPRWPAVDAGVSRRSEDAPEGE